MIRQLPIIPTIIVIAAALTMVGLGVWQMGRAGEKAELIMMYSKSTAIGELASFPATGDGADVWFRRSEVECVSVNEITSLAGRSANGAKGWAMRAQCALANGGTALVDIGFSQSLKAPEWQGGKVTGVIAPGPRLVADPAVGGLQALAKPDPNDLPNNHLAYAGQWFFFALTALVIYGFAVRGRLRKNQ
ncbi:MAG: SURF1 family cytochrome oxidase biogenesis protein [Pseudomonadota bacterium]|nr:SURF1 family cytochrome oxidase biogenesis protein [Pseudomonadota bacterium]